MGFRTFGQPRIFGERLGNSGTQRPSLSSILASFGATYWMNPLNAVYQDGALTTPAADADPVGGVPDALGGATVASQTLTARPTLDIDGINNRRCLLFTAASSQYLAANALATVVSGADTPFSVVLVARLADVADRRAYFSAGNTGTGNSFCSLDASFNTSYRVLRTDDAGSATSSNNGAPSTAAQVITFIFSGTTVTVRVNGVTVTNGDALNVGTITFNVFSIGILRRNALANAMNGRVGHWAFIPRALTVPEAVSVEQIMASDYGITL
jgi:hypothetical protein